MFLNCRVRKNFRCHCGKSYKSIPGFRSHCMIHHPTVDFWNILQRVKPPFHKHGTTIQETLITPMQIASMRSVAHKTEPQIGSETHSLDSIACQAIDPMSLVVSLPTAETAVILNKLPESALE